MASSTISLTVMTRQRENSSGGRGEGNEWD
eukprot:SAG31_NODE_12332_length_949_cov_1.185882_1_plen_29_part_10